MAMISTTDKFTYNSPMSPGASVTVKNTSAGKLLCLLKLKMPNRKLLSAVWVLIDKNQGNHTRQYVVVRYIKEARTHIN